MGMLGYSRNAMPSISLYIGAAAGLAVVSSLIVGLWVFSAWIEVFAEFEVTVPLLGVVYQSPSQGVPVYGLLGERAWLPACVAAVMAVLLIVTRRAGLRKAGHGTSTSG